MSIATVYHIFVYEAQYLPTEPHEQIHPIPKDPHRPDTEYRSIKAFDLPNRFNQIKEWHSDMCFVIRNANETTEILTGYFGLDDDANYAYLLNYIKPFNVSEAFHMVYDSLYKDVYDPSTAMSVAQAAHVIAITSPEPIDIVYAITYAILNGFYPQNKKENI